MGTKPTKKEMKSAVDNIAKALLEECYHKIDTSSVEELVHERPIFMMINSLIDLHSMMLLKIKAEGKK